MGSEAAGGMVGPTEPERLIDTDILVDYTRGVDAAAEFLNEQLSLLQFRVSVVTAMELVQGVRNLTQLRTTQQLLDQATIVLVSDSISLAAYRLMETYRLSHGLMIADALIAATALDQDMVLYTRNVRHFQMIPGLDVRRPY